MSENFEKKPLTTLEDRQNNILRKLILLASDKRNGKLRCEILIRDGLIFEIRHREFENVIR